MKSIREITIVAYRPDWPDQFAAIARPLREALGDLALPRQPAPPCPRTPSGKRERALRPALPRLSPRPPTRGGGLCPGQAGTGPVRFNQLGSLLRCERPVPRRRYGRGGGLGRRRSLAM